MQIRDMSPPGHPPSPHIVGDADDLTFYLQQLHISNTQASDFSHHISQDGGGYEVVG